MTEPRDDVSRGVPELLIGALAGSALLPFVQALATKAGEDVYQMIRDRLSRRARRDVRDEIRAEGTVTLTAAAARVVLRLPERVTPEMALRLENLHLPPYRSGWLLLSWDATQRRWVSTGLSGPPETATSLDP
ncbi:hypothetical protein ACIBMZ_15310 [Micromonospora sp. NPDC049900]|uniref:hypothetical protein n=1 Tax=Micromonospora sp. NPDC049900 TaxID=3364275 RepID=UPI00379FED86